jgi:cupin 2 domain-containing protein
MQIKNIFADIPQQINEELFQQLAGSNGFTLERIVSRGHASAPGQWYDQDDHEWVILLQGSARLSLADQADTIVLRPGDYLLIPAHVKHRVEWTDPERETVWLALHYRHQSFSDAPEHQSNDYPTFSK